MSEWDYLWTPNGGLCSTAEIFMKTPDYAYVISPWLEKVKSEGDKMQERIEQAVLFVKEQMGESYYSNRIIEILEGRGEYRSLHRKTRMRK